MAPEGAVGSTGARDIAAMIVIIGTIDRSWNSRTEKARSPRGWFICPVPRSIGSTCAVEESASGRPIAMLASMLKPSTKWISAAKAMPQTMTCMNPRPKMSLRNRQSRVGFSSRPTRNSRKAMPISDTAMMELALPTSPRTFGPMIAPPTI